MNKTGTIKQCETCNKQYQRGCVSFKQFAKSKFCSHECYWTSKYKSEIKKKVTSNCLICKNSFLSRPIENKKYCSSTCYGVSKIDKNTGENHPNWNGGRPKCLDCGIQLFNYSAKYCLNHCLIGERNPKWKGGEETKKARAVVNQRNREARKNGNGGKYTLEEWDNLIKKFNYMCLCCKRQEPEIKLTVDHILPISLGGRNDIENIQPLCGSCNSRKSIKNIDYISNFYELKQNGIFK